MFFRAERLFQIDLETVGQVRQVAEHIGKFCNVISAVSLALRGGPSALGTDHRGLLGTVQTPILIDLCYANINKISTGSVLKSLETNGRWSPQEQGSSRTAPL